MVLYAFNARFIANALYSSNVLRTGHDYNGTDEMHQVRDKGDEENRESGWKVREMRCESDDPWEVSSDQTTTPTSMFFPIPPSRSQQLMIWILQKIVSFPRT